MAFVVSRDMRSLEAGSLPSTVRRRRGFLYYEMKCRLSWPSGILPGGPVRLFLLACVYKSLGLIMLYLSSTSSNGLYELRTYVEFYPMAL